MSGFDHNNSKSAPQRRSLTSSISRRLRLAHAPAARDRGGVVKVNTGNPTSRAEKPQRSKSFKNNRLAKRIYGNPHQSDPTISLQNRNDLNNIEAAAKDLIPGTYPVEVERKIIAQMKIIAYKKANEDKWVEAYSILRKVLQYQICSNELDTPDVANTRLHLGIASYKIGYVDNAISELDKCGKILYQNRRMMVDHQNRNNRDLVTACYELGVLHGSRSNFEDALFYLDLAKQAEISIDGSASPKTLRMIAQLEHI